MVSQTSLLLNLPMTTYLAQVYCTTNIIATENSYKWPPKDYGIKQSCKILKQQYTSSKKRSGKIFFVAETLLEKAENAIIFFKLPFEQPDFCIIFCSLHELHVQCTQIYKKLMHCKCISIKEQKQCTKKVVSNILGLVDFAIGLVNSVLNLPDGQVIFWGSSNDFLGRQCALFNIDGPRCGSIPISTILQKSVRFFIINVRKSVSIYPRSTLGSHMKFNCSCTALWQNWACW